MEMTRINNIPNNIMIHRHNNHHHLM